MTNTTITRNDTESRYEAHVDGELAGYAQYEVQGDRAVFTHTEVFESHRGEGVAGSLAGEALADATTRGLTIVPMCAFIADYLDGHEVEGATVESPE